MPANQDMNVYETVCQFVAGYYEFPIERVTRETSLHDDMVASLNFAHTAIECEKNFTVLIPDSIVAELGLSTVGKLVDFIERAIEPTRKNTRSGRGHRRKKQVASET